MLELLGRTNIVILDRFGPLGELGLVVGTEFVRRHSELVGIVAHGGKLILDGIGLEDGGKLVIELVDDRARRSRRGVQPGPHAALKIEPGFTHGGNIGQSIAYARMVGVVPPWTAAEMAAKKAKK